MPIRTASLRHQIRNNGVRLHLAMASRALSHGDDTTPSEAEKALLEERRTLKEARAQRQAQAKLPRKKVVKLVRTHHPEAKAPKGPKAPKAAKAPKDAKAAKGHLSRAEKMTKKAENLEAAKKVAKKPAKT